MRRVTYTPFPFKILTRLVTYTCAWNTRYSITVKDLQSKQTPQRKQYQTFSNVYAVITVQSDTRMQATRSTQVCFNVSSLRCARFNPLGWLQT
ncbi:hypothetical protein FKM82_007926 [Ascaphus truei]